jgi:glycosyltransferase involved in cell wall biosynthesis
VTDGHLPAAARRVLLVSHSGCWGGAEKALYLLVAGLSRSRFDPLVIVPHDGPLAAALRGIAVEVLVRPVPWWVGGRGEALACAAGFMDGYGQRITFLERLIRDRGIDVVVSNTLVIADGALAAHGAGVPHVWLVHELLSRDPGLCPPVSLAAFYEVLTVLSAAVVVVSEAVRREIAAFVPAADLTVVHYGLPEPAPDARAESGPSQPPLAGKRVTFIGLLSERKGVATLVEAAAIVCQRHPDAVFWLVGADGGALPAVIDGIGRLHLEDRVFVLGERQDIDEILLTSQMLAHPAVADPFPVVVLEAMRAGLPVVATRSGGCEQLVADGETGFLVPVGDAAALAAGICRLLDDPVRGQEMGRRGRQRLAELFPYRAAIDGYERVLDRVLGHWNASHAAGGRQAAVAMTEEAYRAGAMLHEARGQIRQLEARLAGLEHSLAWRCTAPVRRAIDALRMLSGRAADPRGAEP